MSAIDDRLDRFLSAERTLKDLSSDVAALKSGGGGGTSGGGMEERVTRLETHMEYVQRNMSSIDDKLGRVNDRLNLLPTRGDLKGWQWQWIATGIAIIALTIGGVTGGLALIARFAG